MTPLQKKTCLAGLIFIFTTAAAVSFYGRGDATFIGALLGALLTAAWHRFVLLPSDTEKKLGHDRLELNLNAMGFSLRGVRWQRSILATTVLVVWLVAVIPPLMQPVASGYHWLERILRSEQAFIKVEYPSYLDASPKETPLKGDAGSELEIDQDVYFSVQFKFRKPATLWQVNITSASSGAESVSQTLPPQGIYGHSAKSLLQQMRLPLEGESTVVLTLEKNGKSFASQRIKILPQPRPQVELKRAEGAPAKEGQLPLNVKVRSKIPLSGIEFHVRTASGYRMVKPVAEFANANEQSFDGQNISFNSQGIPFSPKDTLFIKAVAKTVAENLQGESEELRFDIVTRESIRQDLIQSLEKAQQLLQSNSMTAQNLKDNLSKELDKASQSARQMGAQSLAAKQMEKITASADKINSPKDKNAQETEKKIKNLLERLKREQTASQIQNLLARLQNLKFSIQRSTPEQLPQLNKDADELRNAATQLKRQLGAMVEKPASGLSLQEKQTALDALKLDRTPENLKDLGNALQDKKQNDATNKSQSTLEHAQKQLGSVLALLQAARQRAMKDARERLTRADNQLQNARRGDKGAKDSLNKSQQDLDGLPQISDDFQDAARDAQKGNQKARQGEQGKNKEQMESGVDEAQEGIVRALAALQDEEEAERQSQQEQDGQNFRSAQEALAAQSQLDMGWRRQILDEIARLRAKGESADSPAIKYLESRLR
ncbi:MAG: hypothetical protein RIR26_2107 [Pseudomonadota bacterium]